MPPVRRRPIAAFFLAGLAFGLAGLPAAGGTAPLRRTVDDFNGGDLSAWQSSLSPDYYKGGMGRKGLETVADPERGQVLRCDIRFTNPRASEPAFITRQVARPPRRLDVLGIRFWAKLSGPGIDPNGGFKVRLRTSPRAFTDLDVQRQMGAPFPIGRWVPVHLDARFGPNSRNVWNQALDRVRQLTFRLDDVDSRNAHFALFLDDIAWILRPGASRINYDPTVLPRPRNRFPRVLLLKHRAAGHYGIEAAIRRGAPGARVDRFDYRGWHFPFFGFPKTRKKVLAYDLIIMVDIDPIMMTFEQCAWIADAVFSGAHILIFDGPSSLTHAHDWKAPLRRLLPVRFKTGAPDLPVHAPPEPGSKHFLNQGFDPAGLGTVTAVQDVHPQPGARVPWTAAHHPLIVTAAMGNGRATLVNTWPHVRQRKTGGFFTSPLSADLVRRLIQFGLGRVHGAGIHRLAVSAFTLIGPGRVRLRAAGSPRTAKLRLFLDGRPATLGAQSARNGEAGFMLDFQPATRAEETHRVRLELLANGRIQDSRQFPIQVQNPLDLEVDWKHANFTFAPGSPVEFTARLRPRELPRVTPGVAATIADAGGAFPVHIDNFADAWVFQPGTNYVIHNQLGTDGVRIAALPGLFPAWTVAGKVRCARADGSRRFAEDDRILAAKRTIRVEPSGVVTVTTRCTFRADMHVRRLPLTVTLATAIFAGLPCTVVQAGSRIRKGRLPPNPTPGRIFDGRGLDLNVRTPHGPLRIQVPDSTLRVWMRDLRRYDMTAYRLEIEAPFQDRQAVKGESYTIPLRITPPRSRPLNPADSAPGGASAWKAVIRAPGAGYSWTVPLAGHTPASARFAGVLPDLAAGEYRLELAAIRNHRAIVRTTSPCYVVDPLDRAGFFPIMSIIGIRGGGHCLNEAGIRARVRDLVAHGFNTAAIIGTNDFRTDHPDYAQFLNAYAESFAQQCGMAVAFEYTSLQRLRRKDRTRPCVFDPAYRAAVQQDIAWKIDAARRIPRLLSVKVIDEPCLGLRNMDFCKYCRAEFRARFGIPMPRTMPPETAVYPRWALARFISSYAGRAYATTAGLVRSRGARFDLLLTYMAAGLGYGRPLTAQEDALDWSRTVQRADFDVYPYFYPRSQRIRMVQAAFCMAFMRDAARLRKIPWGFYIELDDRNWPFQKNPKEATAECAFTAIAAGADYLNSFIHRLAETGTQARPERWEVAGRALRQIRRLGPLLQAMPAPRAHLALFYPNTQEAAGNGYERPDYFLAALNAGFGDVDLINERTVRETGTIPYAALILGKTEVVHADFVPRLQHWLRAGGTLFCDALPRQDHRGEKINWEFSTRVKGATASEGRIGPFRFTVTPVGRGRIVFLRNDVQAEFRALVEADPLSPARVGDFRRALGALFRRFVHPIVSIAYRETARSVDLIQAGLRGNADAALIFVVNHQPDPQRVTVRLWNARYTRLVDAVTATPIPFNRESTGPIRFSLAVKGRWARCIAAFHRPPVRLEAKVFTPTVRPGGRLRCQARLLDVAGRPVSGANLLDCAVRGPNGRIVTRFSGAHAPRRGILSAEFPVPVNAVPGRYTLTLTAPLAGLTARSAFNIQQTSP